MSDRINLILLEFFVDGVKLDNNLKTSISNYKYGKLSVLFKFLDFPPLQVVEDELPDGQITPEPVFRSGRSGLFSVPDVTNVTPDLLLVDVFVILKLPNGSDSEKFPIGQTKINLTQHFTCITSEAKLCPEKAPVTRSIRESFLIADKSQKFVGVVSLLIRASCFGNMIVQQFKRNYPRRVQDVHQGMQGDMLGVPGHPRGGGDRAVGAAALKATLEKTLPENLSQVLPEGLIDVIANCFSTNSNTIPAGLLESLRQGIVQGVRGVTGTNYDKRTSALHSIPEAASATDTAASAAPAAAVPSTANTNATTTTTRSSPSLPHCPRSPHPHTPSSYQSPHPSPRPYGREPPLQAAQPGRGHSSYRGSREAADRRESLGYRDSPGFGQQPMARCGSPVQYPSRTAMHAPSMGRLQQSARQSPSADRCFTPIQFPSRFDIQGAGERSYGPPPFQMVPMGCNAQPAMYARQSAMMLAREASRSASRVSEGSSSIMREELIRAHTGLYGGNEIVLKQTPLDGIYTTVESPLVTKSPTTSPASTTATARRERSPVTQARSHKHHHRHHHHHRSRRLHKTKSSGKSSKHHRGLEAPVGPVPAALAGGPPIASLPPMSPQLEMHMQQMMHHQGAQIQMKSTPLQQLQERMAAAVGSQPSSPGGQFDDPSKFDVIGTELGGMMLRIHVPKSKKMETPEGWPFQMLTPLRGGGGLPVPAVSAPITPNPVQRQHRHHHHHHHRHHRHHRRHHHHSPGDAALGASPPHSDVNLSVPSPDGTMTAHRFIIKDVSGQHPFAKRQIGPGGRRVVVDESGGGGAAARRFTGKDNSNRRFPAKYDPLRHPNTFQIPKRFLEYKGGDRAHGKHYTLPRCDDRRAVGRHTQYVYREIPSRYMYGKEAEAYNVQAAGQNFERPHVPRNMDYVLGETGRAAAMKNVRLNDVYPETMKVENVDDADSDLYVLKIGTKNDKRADKKKKKKDNFELTVRTPKKVESDVARAEATGPPFIKLSVPQKNRSKSKGSGSNASSKHGKRTRRAWRARDKEKNKRVVNVVNRYPDNVAI